VTAPSARLSADRIGGAAAWRFAYLGIQGGASLILFGALSHVLPRDAFAAAAVAQGILVVAQAIGDFGLSQAAVTVLPARIAVNPERAPALLDGASRSFIGAAGAALALTLGAVVLVPAAAVVPVALIAPATAATVLVAGADGILRAQGEFRHPVLLVAASRGAAFAGVPAGLVTHSAAWTCAAISAGTAFGALGAVRALWLVRSASPDGETGRFIRATIPLGISQLLLVLGTRVDTVLAGAFSGLLAAATFEGAWRIYQIGQYAVGGFATATAPFIADALGAGRHEDLLHLSRRMLVRLLLGGFLVGGVLYVGRDLIAGLLAGSLAGPVARALPALALLSPLSVVGLLALYTLIARDGQRRHVLVAYAAGAAVNVVAAAALAGPLGGRGVVLACAAGLLVTNVILLVRFATLMRGLSAGASEARVPVTVPPGLAKRPR
jgi:O-antigen/teichoic acid export membrane protein